MNSMLKSEFNKHLNPKKTEMSEWKDLQLISNRSSHISFLGEFSFFTASDLSPISFGSKTGGNIEFSL